MSLVTLIRDYVDVANSSEQLDGYTLSSLAYYILNFVFTVIKQVIVYCFTFHWLRDLSYFCLTPPTLLSSFGNVNGIDSQPLSHLLAFSESNFSTGIGIIFVGFFNGCFSYLHLSAANLITIKRLLVQGVPAGLCSAFGTVVGQLSFLACVLFGFRGLLFPWLSIEPLSFLLGTGILLSVASATAQDRRTPTIQWSAKSSLFIYIFTNAALAWCEQAAIFQWMGNLSVGIEPTFLETTPSIETLSTLFGNVQQLGQTISYLLAFCLGSLISAFLLGYMLQRLLEVVLRYKGIVMYYGLVKQANLPLATLIFAFGFGSLPYYGFDYLITKGFGFMPNEPSFQQTLFSPTNLVSKTSQVKESSQGRLEDQLALLFTLEGERSKSFAVDTTPFDNGQYLKASQKRPQAFEDLNYRGEHLWTNRLSRISNIREQANQTQSSFLGPVFSWMRSFLWGDGPTANNYGYTKTLPTSNDPDGLAAEGMLTNPGEKRSNRSNEGIDSAFSEGKDKMQHIRQFNDPSEETSQFLNDNSSKFRSYGNTDEDKKFKETSHYSSGSSTNNPALLPFRIEDKVGEAKEVQQAVGKEASLKDSLVANIKQKKELSPEREQMDNYLKEFDRQFDKGFSNFSNADPNSLIEVEDQWQEKRIKEKCYTNPIYTFLLNTEIDAFLTRQPQYQWLSPQEEALLLKRRQLLSNYYDTLALTNQVSNSEVFGQLVPKSYANAIYNHQFKGTLKVARRLFSVKKVKEKHGESVVANQVLHEKKNRTSPLVQRKPEKRTLVGTETFAEKVPSELDENEQKRIVKFDQPLFSNGNKNSKQILFHEELNVDPSVTLDPYQQTLVSKPEVNTVIKEENKKPNLFLLEQTEPLPLYASWDEQSRKLIITNRFQNRALAGYAFYESPKGFPINFIDPESKNSTIFTIWPIPNPLLNTSNVSTKQRDNELNTNKPYISKKDNVEKSDSDILLKPKTNKHTESKATRKNKIADIGPLNTFEAPVEPQSGPSNAVVKPATFLTNFFDSAKRNLFHQNSKNQFLFRTESSKEPITNDMVNALLQWQKLIKENKQLSKEDKQAAKEKVSHWPENVNRANWSNDVIDNDMEFDDSSENILKKQTLLWEFTPPNHGGFLWPGRIS